MFVVENDYISVIRNERLAEIIQGYEERRLQTERKVDEEVKSFLRHRYDVEKSFPDVLSYDSSTNYYTNDLIEYTEPVYDNANPYVIGNLVSYEFTSGGVTYDYIYICIQNSTGNLPTDTAYWTFVVANKTLYVCEKPATGANITTSYSYDQNAYTSDPDDVTGWDRSTLYFKKTNNDVIYMYLTSADRTAETNYAGVFNYAPTIFPATREIQPGTNPDTLLGGTIQIKGFIADDTEWEVIGTNNFSQRDNRNQMILGIYIKMIVYELHFSINPRNIPQHRLMAYEDAKTLLKDISKGNNVTADLPIHEEDEQRGQRFSYGSSDNIDEYHY